MKEHFLASMFYSFSATEHIASEGLLCPEKVREAVWSSHSQLCEPVLLTLNLDLISGSQIWTKTLESLKSLLKTQIPTLD